MIEFDENPPKSLNEMKLELATKWQDINYAVYFSKKIIKKDIELWMQ